MKKIVTIILFLLIPLCLTFSNPFNRQVTTIILDAGHGGSDPGAVATENGLTLQEKNINLEITLSVKELLEEQLDCNVLLSRSDDSFISLAQRAAFAADNEIPFEKSNILISIHVNSSTGNEATGFEIIIKEGRKRVSFLDSLVKDWALFRFASYPNSQLNELLNRQNSLLATYLLEALENNFPDERSRGIKEQDLWVLNGSKIPSVLVEVGFLSNSFDFKKLATAEYRKRMAEAISAGIVAYVNRN
ncbi:MAG: N-acetylmuramoyl-L-alanine amidase [Sphaerochaetaceae bacterium]